MKRISVETITGTETLAKEIATSGGLVLIPSGMKLKKEYKDKLQGLGITYIYIEDSVPMGSGMALGLQQAEEDRIKTQCQKAVVETLEKFSYLGTTELSQIKTVAEEIISGILEEPEVMYSVSGIRNQNSLIYDHSLNVCGLSVLLALKMKLPRQKVEQIAIGSLLHDIGYNFISPELLQRDYAEVSAEEQIELRKHVIYGFEAIQKETWLSPTARNIILYHHENLDGSGYPFHLIGNKIKRESRIVEVCDLFDRLVYGISCKAMKVHKAIKRVASYSDTKLDSAVIKVFLQSVASYPNGIQVLIDDGRTGVVVRQSPKCPTRPVVRILADGTELDLSKEKELSIVDTV